MLGSDKRKGRNSFLPSRAKKMLNSFHRIFFFVFATTYSLSRGFQPSTLFLPVSSRCTFSLSFSLSFSLLLYYPQLFTKNKSYFPLLSRNYIEIKIVALQIDSNIRHTWFNLIVSTEERNKANKSRSLEILVQFIYVYFSKLI